MNGNLAIKGSNPMLRRSELSSNWRTNTDKIPNDAGNESVRPRASTFADRTGSQNDNTSTSTQNTIRGENDPETLQAIAEGRRLYVGNMPYFAKLHDIQDLFKAGDYNIIHINMSVDPYTGRNPSYCFVELETKEQADHAMYELNGIDLLGRPVKIGPGVAKSDSKRPRGQRGQGGRKGGSREPIFNRWRRTDAAEHWTGYSEEGRRLWVGGLPPMDGHLAVNDGVRELFKGFKPEAVSKVIIPAKPAFGEAGAWNHRYLFVEFSTAEEADRAANATNGQQAWGVKIRVMPARPFESRKIGEREAWQQEDSLVAGGGSTAFFKRDFDEAP